MGRSAAEHYDFMTLEQQWNRPEGGAEVCHPNSCLRDFQPASAPTWVLKSEALLPEPTASPTLSSPECSSGDPSPDPLPEDPQKEEENQGLSEPGLRNFVAVLRRRNFLLLWTGQVCSQLADKVLLVLLIGLIARKFQPEGASISGWVSAIMLAFTLPAMLLGSLAGVFVDRWLKKGVLVLSNLARGILVLLLPLLLWLTAGRDLWPGIPLGFVGLLLVSLAVSTLTQFFAPAEQAILPLILPKRELLAANSLYTTTMMASLIVGFAVGEPLLTLADHWVRHWLPGWEVGPELLVGGAYLLAGSLLLLLQPHEKLEPRPWEAPHLWEDLQLGLQYVGQMPLIRAALLQVVVLYSLFAALAVLAVRMAEVMPELRPDQFGVLLAAAGLGMGIGAFWVGHAGRRVSCRAWSGLGSLLLCGSLAALSWTTHWLLLSLGWIALLGCGGALVAVPMQTLIQEETPDHLRGKIFGLQNNVANIALSLPLVLTGLAETYFGLSGMFLGLAALAALAGLYTWSLLGREGW
ncbi:MFS transporter [Synechococcus sp. H55.10]|uniref:MFS transporter n=1 Tax=Synechococcus sp. H55.10 TaxID=2964503 RepID=UPI0039C5EAC2